MLRKVLAVAIIFVSCLVISNSAFAVPAQSAYMTVADNNTTAQSGTPATYSWDQKPWLYFTSPSDIVTYSVSWWNLVGDTVKTPEFKLVTGTNQVWQGLDNWNSIKKAGLWTVRADYSTPTTGGSTGDVSFKINAAPEPIGAALFMIGAGALGIIKNRRNKKAKV